MSDDDLAREVDRHAEQGAQLARTMDGHLAPPRDRLILSLVAENQAKAQGRRAVTSDDRPVVPIGSGDLHLAARLFDPARLTLARELRGLTKSELAERVHRSAAAIGQFEGAGKTSCKPDAATLASIAVCLGLPVGFFARRGTVSRVEIESCHFRSLRSATQRDRKRLLAQATLIHELVSLLEEFVDLPKEQIPRASRIISDLAEIEQLAELVRRTWGLGLGPIPNLVRLLETRGTLVTTIPDECEGVDAFSTWLRGRPHVFMLEHRDAPSRSRFDAAHELGHLVMHADAIPGDMDLERQAHRFASAFLFPREPFLQECPRRVEWDAIFELKARWRISAAAIVRRGYDLQVFSRATYERAMIHMNKTGWRRREPHEVAAEVPTLLAKSMEAIADDQTIASIASQMAVSVSELLGIADRASLRPVSPSITLDVSPRVTRHLRRPTGEGPDERGQGTPGAEGGG